MIIVKRHALALYDYLALPPTLPNMESLNTFDLSSGGYCGVQAIVDRDPS